MQADNISAAPAGRGSFVWKNCRQSAKERRPLPGETDALRDPPPAIRRVRGWHRRRSTQRFGRRNMPLSPNNCGTPDEPKACPGMMRAPRAMHKAPTTGKAPLRNSAGTNHARWTLTALGVVTALPTAVRVQRAWFVPALLPSGCLTCGRRLCMRRWRPRIMPGQAFGS